MMRGIMGITFFLIGIGSADSECLLIPLALTLIGLILLKGVSNERKAER